MSFLRPASPNPLQLPSSPMDGSRMDFSTTMSSPISNPNSTPNTGYNFTNPHSRVIHSPTPAHMRARTRRPSSLSLGFDRIKTFGFGTSSSSSPSSGGPNTGTSGVVQSNNTAGTSGLLPAAPIIFDTPADVSNSTLAGRGRASSTASSMSFSFSPARRSISLEDTVNNNNNGNNNNSNNNNTAAQNGMDENEETPQRKRAVIGITGQNESESSLSNASNGRNTPDMHTRGSLDLGLGGIGISRGIEDDVEALAMDFAGSSGSSPSKDGLGIRMNQTPPRGTVPLADVSPFASKGGAFKPAGLLRIQNELTAPFLDGETRSEAAFTRLVASTSDLASRLRLTNGTPSSSPARTAQRKPRRWMEEWAAKTAGNTGIGIPANGNGMPPIPGAAASVMANGGAGRFPESVHGDGDGPNGGSDETDSEGDDAAEATFVVSRPSSGMGHAAMPIGIGRSRSGSGVLGDSMMMFGSYGAGGEMMGDGGMDLDMVSNMSSPVSTPAATSWREPAPFFQSKKRKFSAAVDSERQDLQPHAKKRKGLSPHGTVIPLSASSASPFNFAQPRSPQQFLQGAQLSMTAITAPNTNQMTGNAYFSPFSGGQFSATSGTALGMTGVGGAPMNHQHRKSGSMSWSRPGSAHSSPLLRPTTGNGNSGMPAPPGMLLGPSMLSISSTPAESNPNQQSNNPGSFNFNFSPGRTSSGVFPQFSHMPMGEFGAPLTASPSNRPMMKLPERASHGLGATNQARGAGSGGIDSSIGGDMEK